MASMDLNSLKQYVAGGKRTVAADTVLLDVTHNHLKQRFMEIPFTLHMTIAQVKDKLYTLCGSQIEHMQVMLNGTQELHNDNATLAQYGVQSSLHSSNTGGSSSNQFLHVIDTDPFALSRSGGLDDVSKVKKYEMSDEDYKKRENTYLSYKNKQKAADPNWKSIFERNREKARAARPEETETLAEVQTRCPLASRCQVSPGARRGIIAYVGHIAELTANPVITTNQTDADEVILPVWIGVQLDEPIGKHDGQIHGKRYFQTLKHCACFVRPSQVECGAQFVERDPFDEDSDQENEKQSEKDQDKPQDAEEDIMQEL